jgi:aspartate--ammonia ligase
MQDITLPGGYRSLLSVLETQTLIKVTKDFFETNFARELDLTRVSGPLFLAPETGLNDDLNGAENPVSFTIEETGARAQIVQSLAKWKRFALKKYDVQAGRGIYVDMNAIRPSEITDRLHSIYVDQWDWEKVIQRQDRTIQTLKKTVKKIYKVLKMTEKYLHQADSRLEPVLPDEITFVTSQELEDEFPNLTPRARETEIARRKKAVFVMKIGGKLKSGKAHDGRAPDYDDWDLNGDIIFYHKTLDCALEISSMGVRVDEETLKKQLKIADCEDRLSLNFHKELAAGRLPQTIGGGIGQSRMCMFFLKKAHIGEAQVSIWPSETIEFCVENGIFLL